MKFKLFVDGKPQKNFKPIVADSFEEALASLGIHENDYIIHAYEPEPYASIFKYDEDLENKIVELYKV